jgi:hypothetical protein
LLTERGGDDAEVLGCAAHASQFDDSDEVAKLSQFHLDRPCYVLATCAVRRPRPSGNMQADSEDWRALS